MVLRTDGKQIGVQIDEHMSGRFTQHGLALKALNPFDFDAPLDRLQGIKLSMWTRPPHIAIIITIR